MKAIYLWSEGTRIKSDPQMVGEELTRLQKRGEGMVAPQEVVKAARRESSPLHSCFEWRDDEAARLYREEQAHYILRHIEVEIKADALAEAIVVRAFLNVRQTDKETEEESRGYVDVKSVLSDDAWRAQITGEMVDKIRRIRGELTRYESLIESFATAQLPLAEAEAVLAEGIR